MSFDPALNRSPHWVHPAHRRTVRRLPPLNAIRTFEAAARHGSFLKAAAELHVTPGAVSRLVKSLEEYLDVELFNRSHRSIRLTEEGRLYSGAVTQALRQLELATEHLVLNNSQNVVRICCHPTFAVHWLIPRYADFQAAHPDCQLDLRTTLTPESEDVDAYDFVVRIAHESGETQVDRIASVRLVDVVTFPVCAPSLVAQHGPFECAEDLRGHQMIHAALRPNDWNRWLESAGFAVIDRPRGPVFETLALAYNAAISGAGIAIGVHAFVENDLRAGRLVRLYTHTRQSASGFNLTYSSVRARRFAKMRRFLEWARAQRDMSTDCLADDIFDGERS